MNSSKKPVSIIVFVLLILLAVSFILPVAYSPWTPIKLLATALQANRTRVHLLCKTDHQVLLESCRELSNQVAIGELKPGKYRIRYGRRLPVVSGFPQPILDLEPSYVFIDTDGRMMMEMLGGLGHFGIKAYPEDYKVPHSDFKFGDKELTDGLWYYDDNYERDPKFDKRIDAIIQKGKMGSQSE